MPLYADLYHYGVGGGGLGGIIPSTSSYGSSYGGYTPSPMFTPSFSGYGRTSGSSSLGALGSSSSSYGSTPVSSRSAFAAINRHYKPMLTTISESAYQTARRPHHPAAIAAMTTNLTRIHSPKINVHHHQSSSSYTAPRPIQINTADIDVSSSRYHTDRSAAASNRTPERIVYGTSGGAEATNNTSTATPSESPFMPRIDQNDPPHRCTIKRDRNIVRLSTMRQRSKSKSRGSSSSKRTHSPTPPPPSPLTPTSPQSSYSGSGSFQHSPSPEKPGKSSWRDRFGDDLLTKPKDPPRKSPGELILEKHIIRDNRRARQEAALAAELLRAKAEQREQLAVHSGRRKSSNTSSRRNSILRCPSFKDICKDISADIRQNDDLNAGELRQRRASLIMEEENQILAGLCERRQVKIDDGEKQGGAAAAEDTTAAVHVAQSGRTEDPLMEEVVVMVRKSHRKSTKLPYRISVSPVVVVEVVEEQAEASDKVQTVGEPVVVRQHSPKWNAVVEHVTVDHSVDHKVFKLPKKKAAAVKVKATAALPKDGLTAPKVQKSASGEDFWGAIGSRETVYYDDRRRQLLAKELARKEQEMQLEMAEQKRQQELAAVEEKARATEVKAVADREKEVAQKKRVADMEAQMAKIDAMLAVSENTSAEKVAVVEAKPQAEVAKKIVKKTKSSNLDQAIAAAVKSADVTPKEVEMAEKAKAKAVADKEKDAAQKKRVADMEAQMAKIDAEIAKKHATEADAKAAADREKEAAQKKRVADMESQMAKIDAMLTNKAENISAVKPAAVATKPTADVVTKKLVKKTKSSNLDQAIAAVATSTAVTTPKAVVEPRPSQPNGMPKIAAETTIGGDDKAAAEVEPQPKSPVTKKPKARSPRASETPPATEDAATSATTPPKARKSKEAKSKTASPQSSSKKAKVTKKSTTTTATDDASSAPPPAVRKVKPNDGPVVPQNATLRSTNDNASADDATCARAASAAAAIIATTADDKNDNAADAAATAGKLATRGAAAVAAVSSGSGGAAVQCDLKIAGNASSSAAAAGNAAKSPETRRQKQTNANEESTTTTPPTTLTTTKTTTPSTTKLAAAVVVVKGSTSAIIGAAPPPSSSGSNATAINDVATVAKRAPALESGSAEALPTSQPPPTANEKPRPVLVGTKKPLHAVTSKMPASLKEREAAKVAPAASSSQAEAEAAASVDASSPPPTTRPPLQPNANKQAIRGAQLLTGAAASGGGGGGDANDVATTTTATASNNNLSKFSATLANLNKLPPATSTAAVGRSRRSKAHSNTSKRSSGADNNNNNDDDNDSYCLSGEESEIWSVHYSDVEGSATDEEDNDDGMGLKPKRRPRRNRTKMPAAAGGGGNKQFDPKANIKLDTKRKCYVVEEAPKYPMIATPRPLQKRWHYFSDSDVSNSDSDSVSPSGSSSDSDEDESGSDDGCYNNNVRLLPGERRGSIETPVDGGGQGASGSGGTTDAAGGSVRMSTCSNDSGFEGGTAPASPKKMLDCDVNCHKKCEKLTANLCGVNQKLIVEALSSVRRGPRNSRDSPSTPPSSNPALRIDPHGDDLETSYTFAQFQRSGRITAPATTIPRFKKYAVDDFHFLTVLGKGSFGKVLLAELRNTEYYYAVKCLKKDVVLEDDDVECTLIERKVLALGTNHPYLCHLFCTFQTESHLFFVMEYLNGGDLMFHIQVSGRFPEPRAKFYAAEIISGLKFLHKKGIIYRDLKLDNILLDFDGHVRIADFGMCKLQIYLDRTADSFCGTPDYMAPEVIKGQNYNQAVDWWSFGVLLYEMLIGQSPFSGCDEDELFWSICNEVPWYPFYISKDAVNVLSKLMEKDATTRMGAPMSQHEDICESDFFYDIDWRRLEKRQLPPPFKPQVKHPLDTQYFDRAFTRERVRLTPIDKEILQSMDQKQFQGFTYTNPNTTPS